MDESDLFELIKYAVKLAGKAGSAESVYRQRSLNKQLDKVMRQIRAELV